MTIDNINDLQSNLNQESASSEDYQVPLANEARKAEVYQTSLLEEKLQVARRQQKVGEIVVRKQVETRYVKIPIRQEKLIVERVGLTSERLTEVVTSKERVNGFSYEELTDTDSIYVVKSCFLELSTAQKLLEEMGKISSASNAKIRIEIATNSDEQQVELQNICDRVAYPKGNRIGSVEPHPSQ